ncbi:TolC family protein [Spirosoma sp. KUDC1026]|uniref:TolC family protein n=1 Tax=Spirosoma sp. KUDC1026 TaxID=2745947 RepID=UPI00159BBC8C|nr:TolC family protein [Spirosoma sp. KUDC1026]QKZ13421.1 TolC family protein [Spirosoma sp. KUDC1026]
MFSVLRINLLVLVIFLSTAVGFGQTRSARGLVSFGQSSGSGNDSLFLDIDKDIAVQLMPFDELVKIAVASSPLMKYQNELVNSLDAVKTLSKFQVLQNVSGYANYSGGNQSLISSSATLPQGDFLGQIANGYRVGVDVRVTLYDIFGRKYQVRQAQSNLKAAAVQKDIIELQIRREMITIYQDMITAQQMLKIRLLDEQSSLTALRVAEAEQQKGTATAEIIANATTRYVQTKSISEQVKGDFLKSVHQFEALVGVPIQRLKRY